MTIAEMKAWEETLRFKSKADLLQDLHDMNERHAANMQKFISEFEAAASLLGGNLSKIGVADMAKATNAMRSAMDKANDSIRLHAEAQEKLKHEIARSRRFYQVWGRAPLYASAPGEVN